MFKNILIKILAIFICVFWSIIALSLLINLFFKNHIYPLKYKEEVIEYSTEYNLDERLVFSFIKVESNFKRKAESKKGAIGLMQILPSTGEYIAEKINLDDFDLYDAETNIQIGCFYIRYLLDKFLDIDTMIVAYNAGEGKVLEWLNNKEYSEDKISLKRIPYKESEEYLKKIKETFEKYKKIYGDIVDK